MSKRAVKFKEGSIIEPCPKCGNKLEFIARSEQVCEDCCEVWIECKCGYDPFTDGNRLDDVWGGVDDDNVKWAINEWNELITSLPVVTEDNQNKKL
jgi:hypothetical protein